MKMQHLNSCLHLLLLFKENIEIEIIAVSWNTITAQAVITSDVPAYAIVVGNPAKVIRYRFEPKTVERLLELCWWDWESNYIAANLDLLYTNPDEWLPEIQLKQPQGDVLKLIGMPSAEHRTDQPRSLPHFS